MKAITQIVNFGTRVMITAEKVRNEEEVTTSELRYVIDKFEDVCDDVYVI